MPVLCLVSFHKDWLPEYHMDTHTHTRTHGNSVEEPLAKGMIPHRPNCMSMVQFERIAKTLGGFDS